MENLYGSWGGVRVKGLTNINDFNKMASYLSVTLSRELVGNLFKLKYIKKINMLIRTMMYVGLYIVELMIVSKCLKILPKL